MNVSMENQQDSDENTTTPSKFSSVQWLSRSGSEQSTTTCQTAETELEEGVPNDYLYSLLECPVCFGYMMPPIMQCHRGHMICQSCRQMVTLCPVCRVNLTTIRNLAMEKVASKLVFPCKYSHLGCRARLAYAEKSSHEERCECSLYKCPYPDEKCVWQGPLDDVFQHLLVSHENIITMEGTDIIFLATNVNLEGALDWTMVQTCFGRHFLLSLEKVTMGDDFQQFIATCRIIGTVREAANFEYYITLETNKRTLRWKSSPKSIRESITFVDSDFLVLNKATVQLFAKDGDLALNVVIKMLKEASEPPTVSNSSLPPAFSRLPPHRWA
ncbi:probable E3 ubiquitin-protein ligase sinah [Drosophila serrata]|uniref:probable E3 ubiquitin-protein ligase sinah n=1 Tax=Drosophila serrata TaxID=7274 RepID=UPI000A1CFBE7|nr:probable E3 ubiquitin-protein ligase sinah [Drosophila serrata]